MKKGAAWNTINEQKATQGRKSQKLRVLNYCAMMGYNMMWMIKEGRRYIMKLVMFVTLILIIQRKK